MARKTLGIAAALGLVLAGGVTLNQGIAALTGQIVVARLLGAPGALTFGTADIDAAHGLVTFHDVRLTDGSLHVYARRLTLCSDAQARQGGLLKVADQPQSGAGSATASDVTITTEANTYLVKKIDLTGTSLGNGDLTALLDPKSPETLETRLKKINAASVVVSGITSDKTTADGTVHAEIAQLQLADVANGRIGTAKATGFSLSGLGVKAAGAVKMGPIEASGLDLALLNHVLDSRRLDEAEPLKPLAETLTIHDVSLTNSANHNVATIATITEKGLKARPLKTDFKALQAAEKSDAADDDEAKAARSKAVAEDVLSSFEASSFAIEKVAFATTDENSPVKGRIGAIAFDGYKNRKFGNLAVHDVVLDAPRVKASVAALDLVGFYIPALDKPANGESTNDLTTDHLPSAAKADLNGLVVDIDTPGDDGTVSELKFNIAHIGSTSDSLPGQQPVQGTVTVDQLTFDLPGGDRAAAKELLAMGYKKLNISAAIASKFDQGDETLTIKRFNVNGIGLGSLTLAIDLVNVNRGIFSSNPSIAKASALAVLLKHVDLTVENTGLFDKSLALKANQNGKSVAEERRAEEDFFAVELPEAAGNDPALKSVGAAVAKFIAAPKNLHISVTAKDGLGVTDISLLGNPAAILSRLEIHAEANQ
ncbi:MAG: hypothetical protein P4L76_18385 [Beijerinckiaceae bacterium]|nr:hypothetical protein [Beijerinckiaceae bacterium]